MKVLLDLNVIFDVVLNRSAWVTEAKQIWNAHQSGAITGFVAATEFTNLFYIVRRLAGATVARSAVGICLATFEIAIVDRQTLEDADAQSGLDFEDNVCVASAKSLGIDWIVTRDSTGFSHNPIPVVSPTELIARLSLPN